MVSRWEILDLEENVMARVIGGYFNQSKVTWQHDQKMGWWCGVI